MTTRENHKIIFLKYKILLDIFLLGFASFSQSGSAYLYFSTFCDPIFSIHKFDDLKIDQHAKLFLITRVHSDSKKLKIKKLFIERKVYREKI
jgi:hypothetical protein